MGTCGLELHLRGRPMVCTCLRASNSSYAFVWVLGESTECHRHRPVDFDLLHFILKEGKE